MEVFMLFPESPQTQKALQRTLAQFQAEQALKHIRLLPCSAEQKLELIDTAVRYLKGRKLNT